MTPAPIPANETERLADLRAIELLDTPPEDRFDRIVRLANRILDAPIAYIALIDDDRQWFKARTSANQCTMQERETARDISFCGHTILQDEPLIIPDARKDPRFTDNPMVVSEPFVRFYAGHPLKGPGGHNIATLCVADTKPREMAADQVELLKQLAELAEHELNLVDLVGTQRQLLDTKNQLVATQNKLAKELADAAAYVRASLPEPITTGPIRVDHRFIASSQLGGDLFGYQRLPGGQLAGYLLDATGHGVAPALLAVSAAHAINRQTLPDTDFTDPASVLRALNHAFPIEQNDGRFFTIWYGVLDPDTRELRYATAGHHPALRFGPGLTQPEHLGEPALMIGVDPDADYRTRSTQLAPSDRVYLFSDGAFELFNPDRKMLGLQGLTDVLDGVQHSATNRLDAVTDTLRAYQEDDAFADDYSVIELTISE